MALLYLLSQRSVFGGRGGAVAYAIQITGLLISVSGLAGVDRVRNAAGIHVVGPDGIGRYHVILDERIGKLNATKATVFARNEVDREQAIPEGGWVLIMRTVVALDEVDQDLPIRVNVVGEDRGFGILVPWVGLTILPDIDRARWVAQDRADPLRGCMQWNQAAPWTSLPQPVLWQFAGAG